MKISRFFVSICLMLLVVVSVFPQNDDKTESNEEISQCKIRLKVEFLKTGKIGKTSLVSNTCNDKNLENDAVEAAKKIEFEPKVENGKKVTVTKTVEFNFTVDDKEIGSAENFDFENYDDVLVFARSYKPLKILYKPRPTYPQFDGKGSVCIQGTVTLRVQFLATGEIGEITAVSKLPYGATENAVEAARNMKFTPLMKDGIPTTVTRSVQFVFTIY